MSRRDQNHPLARTGFVLNVHKEVGWTSHDAVARVRGILGFRKVGHTGTLDPFATGVLLCCVGRATKLSNALMDLRKEYVGWMRWGIATDSGDRTGAVTDTWSTPCPSLDALRAAAGEFVGEIMQVPPMVSAIKQDGRRLYELARQGITVARAPRPVFVASFEILEREDARARFRVRCSRGTYVRVLVEDLARALGGGASVDELCRTAVGDFTDDDAVRLDEIADGEMLRNRAMTMATAVGHLPAWKVPAAWAAKMRRGQTPPWSALEIERAPAPGETGRLISTAGELIALGRAELTPGPADRNWEAALSLDLMRIT